MAAARRTGGNAASTGAKDLARTAADCTPARGPRSRDGGPAVSMNAQNTALAAGLAADMGGTLTDSRGPSIG